MARQHKEKHCRCHDHSANGDNSELFDSIYNFHVSNLFLDEAGIYDEKSVLRSQHRYAAKTSKYAMLPVWLLNVDYTGEKYTFAVNGETGEAVGKLPLSKGRLAGSIFGTFAISQIVLGLIMMIL